MCYNTINKDPPHLKCVATLPCEMSSVAWWRITAVERRYFGDKLSLSCA